MIPGKIVRSGYVPTAAAEQPIIEVNGKLQFSLPGQPLFPDLGDDTVLKPDVQLAAAIRQARQVRRRSRLRHRRVQLEANYNLVSPEKGDLVDLVGWITMNNNSGKTFENAKIKLMAGDVNKIQPPHDDRLMLQMSWLWPMNGRRTLPPSRKKPSTNFIFIRHRAGDDACTTAKPNRLNSFTPKTCLPRPFTFMTARPAIASTAD